MRHVREKEWFVWLKRVDESAPRDCEYREASFVKYRTVIFDLDGTISDPSEGISRSLNFALDKHGYDTVQPGHIRQMIGPPLSEIYAHFLGDLPEERMMQLVDSYRERYIRVGYSENVIYDGIPETIAALAYRGHELGVCTSKREDQAIRIIDMFELDSFFSFIDGGDIHIKKHMQLEGLIANGIDPNAAVMVGDRWIDIEAARMNGMDTIGVCWGFGSIDELNRAEPNRVARSPAELLELIT